MRHGGVEVEEFGGRNHEVVVVVAGVGMVGGMVVVGMEDAGVEEAFFAVVLLVGGEDEGTDAVQVDEGKGLLHLRSALQDVRLH